MRGLRLGYLPQEAMLSGDGTLWEECLTVMTDLRQLEGELAQLEALMSDPEQTQQALERYGQLQQIFEHRGGYTYETRIRQTLSGLGFESTDYHLVRFSTYRAGSARVPCWHDCFFLIQTC